MEGKGTIRFFLILLVLVCLVQFLYLIPTRKVEKAADVYADIAASKASSDDVDIVRKEARVRYLDSMSSEVILKVPLLANYTYSDLKENQLAFGLDLKGGLSEVLQVDLKEFVQRLSRDSKDPTFIAALDAADEKLNTTQSDFITLFSQEWASRADGKQLAHIFGRNATLRDQITYETSDADVIRVLREEANKTVELTYSRLKDRIDKFGVTQPNVQLDANRDLILVELPGVDNMERARNFLQASAELEFWDVYHIDNAIQQGFIEADRILKADEAGEDVSVEEDSVEIVPNYEITYDSLGNALDSTLTGYDTVAAIVNPFDNLGPLLSKFTLNGQQGQLQFPLHVMGIAEENKMKAINEMLSREDVRSLFPDDVRFLWAYKPFRDYETGEETKSYLLHAIKLQSGTDKAPLDGECVVRAFSQPDPNTGEVQVTLRMNPSGAQTWGQMTTDAVQAGNREIAIVLDDQVVSAPRVNTPILDGNSSITGAFTIQEGQDLANILEIGKLPAKTKVIQETLVGPSLGKENIQKSSTALIIGMIVLVLFVIAYYAGGGIVAVITLLANLFFIFGALSSIGTVLTLPGIAGIILTIGMAVDANVIIFERIKEELRAGKTLRTAIFDGFKYSYSAIIDANVTTILVALVLAYFGLGPIKGFAVVLIIGVISSLVTAVLLGRLIIDWWLNRDKSITFWSGWSKDILANLNIDWLGKRKLAYIISGILIVASLASIMTRGFEFGLDFKGGYSYNVQMSDEDAVSIDQVRDALQEAFEGTPTTVKAVDLANTLNISTSYRITESGNEVQDQVTEALYRGIKSATGGDFDLDHFINPDSRTTHITTLSKVGPTIAGDITSSSKNAGLIALALIFLYIFIRFNRWQYSLGAVVALAHDSIIVLGVFSLFHGVLPFSMEIDQAFIAALLTVIGYSINDTVVIFDRIREYLGLYINRDKSDIINAAINSTVSRTIITSLTTLMVVFVLFLFGGGSIKGFAFALLVGIMVGTYSSVLIATPIVNDLTDDMSTKKIVKRRQLEKTKTGA